MNIFQILVFLLFPIGNVISHLVCSLTFLRRHIMVSNKNIPCPDIKRKTNTSRSQRPFHMAGPRPLGQYRVWCLGGGGRWPRKRLITPTGHNARHRHDALARRAPSGAVRIPASRRTWTSVDSLATPTISHFWLTTVCSSYVFWLSEVVSYTMAELIHVYPELPLGVKMVVFLSRARGRGRPTVIMWRKWGGRWGNIF